MGLSDCEKCWETPCICGYKYRNWSTERRYELIKAILSSEINESISNIVAVPVKPDSQYDSTVNFCYVWDDVRDEANCYNLYPDINDVVKEYLEINKIWVLETPPKFIFIALADGSKTYKFEYQVLMQGKESKLK